MVVLSYGYKNPENGDAGSIWFPALNFNIVRLNAHTHDGVDSAFISSSNILNSVATVPAAAWIADGTGRYRQTVSTPAGYNMDDFAMQARILNSHIIYPTIERVSNLSFLIYTLDNTLTYEVVFG